MEQTRLDAIRARREAATPGPWRVVLHNEDYGQGYGETTFFVEHDGELLKIGIADTPEKYTKYSALAEYIAHSREDVPYLQGVIDGLRAELEAANKRAEAAERDMIEAVRYRKDCETCKHYKGGFCLENSGGRLCGVQSRWEWRGPEVEKE